MKDDQEFNIWFVKEIERNSCLYNTRDRPYNNKIKQDEAWQNIATSASATVTECKERWKNLRACYTRHLKHQHLELKSGFKCRKPYYLAEHMDFILPFTRLRSQPPEDMQCITDTLKCTDDVVFVDNDNMEDGGHNFRYFNESEEASYESEVASYADITHDSPELKPNTGDAGTSGLISECQEGSRHQLKRKHPHEEEDPDLSFLKSLLPDMRAMNNNQKRQFKLKILTLTDEILNGS